MAHIRPADHGPKPALSFDLPVAALNDPENNSPTDPQLCLSSRTSRRLLHLTTSHCQKVRTVRRDSWPSGWDETNILPTGQVLGRRPDGKNKSPHQLSFYLTAKNAPHIRPSNPVLGAKHSSRAHRQAFNFSQSVLLMHFDMTSLSPSQLGSTDLHKKMGSPLYRLPILKSDPN